MAEAQIILPYKKSLAGFYKLQAINVYSGKVRELTPWFPNRMLLSGMNQMADFGNWMDSCQVGTGSNIAQPTDTSLQTYLAGTTTVVAGSETFAARSTAPYYGYRRKTFRFAQGDATGNISEVGVGWEPTSGAYLISRARVINELGEYTTATVLSNEILDVTYELRYYPPLDDVTGSVTLDGVNYDTTLRAADVNNANSQAQYIGSQMGYQGALSDWSAYDGTLGTIIQSPNGTSTALAGSLANGTYVNNSYKIKMTANCSDTGWNLGSGIRSIRIQTSGGAFQTQFTANPGGGTIPKTSSYTMTMVWELEWGEAKILNAAVGQYVINGYPVDWVVA